MKKLDSKSQRRKKASPVSFICEHTGEYVLIPKLIELLAPDFSHIVPIYFWASREGSTMSWLCGQNTLVRIMGVFSRRPKVYTPNATEITVKFNQQLFQVAYNGSRAGIPILAGVPLASCLMQLGLSTPCAWFHLRGEKNYYNDLRYRLTLDGHVISTESGLMELEGPLDEHAIRDIAIHSTKPVLWEDAIHSIRSLRTDPEIGGYFYAFLGGYKPFYLLLLE